MPDLAAVVASNVRAERARRRWKQRELAVLLNWSISMVSDTESGQRRIALADLPNFCRAFQVPLSELVKGADPQDLDALGL